MDSITGASLGTEMGAQGKAHVWLNVITVGLRCGRLRRDNALFQHVTEN